jgi:putative Mg2+ transporter-C (MgtC) family protein
MWVLAGIGLAIGSGTYAPAIVGTAILLVTLSLLGWIEGRITPPRHFVYFHVVADRRPGLIDDINRLAEGVQVSLGDFGLKREDGGVRFDFALTLPTAKRDQLIDGILDLEGVRDVRVNE